MDLEHIKYMLNSDKINESIMLDHVGLKPSSLTGIDLEILLELFTVKPCGEDWANYRDNLNL